MIRLPGGGGSNTGTGTGGNPLADARRRFGGRGRGQPLRPPPRGHPRRGPPPRDERGGIATGAAGWDSAAGLARKGKEEKGGDEDEDEDDEEGGRDDKKERGARSQRRSPPPPRPSRRGGNGAASDAVWESLWHKKTHGGYRLFASFYHKQPAGVVVVAGVDAIDGSDDAHADDSDATAKAEDEASEVVSARSLRPPPLPAIRSNEERGAVPGGMSRASLRRRRRNNHDRSKQKQKKRPRIDDDNGADPAADSAETASCIEPEGDDVEGGSTQVRADRAARGEVDGRRPLRSKREVVDSTSRHRTANDVDPHPLMTAFRDVIATTRMSNVRDNIHPHQQRLDGFFRAMSRPLPVSFRIRRGMDPAQEKMMRSGLHKFVEAGVLRPVPGFAVAAAAAAAADDESVVTPHAYQSLSMPATSNPKDAASAAITKANLKASCPELKTILNDWSLKGGIARQEVGSMLPVLLLQAARHLPGGDGPAEASARKSTRGIRVLDLCASPGSKTLQAAELLLLRPPSKHRNGTVIRANDVHPTRLEALKDAVKRSGIPNVDSIIKYSQIDATQFPIPTTEAKKYDVVICDVPCSGDGTCRKDRHLLPNWTPRIGTALHSTQLDILVRALRLVKVGGTVSYSTCSLNPVENEAVVAAALQRASPSMVAATTTTTTTNNNNPPPRYELVQLPTLKNFVLRPGVSTWRVADSISLESDETEGAVLRWHETYEDAIKVGMEDAVPTLWPPHPETCYVAQHLDRCRRLLPQDQDTGGFFVALIQRVS
jgi:16S rRNA C967 or C1407 C5-methylase (RsmB/RsmF family)